MLLATLHSHNVLLPSRMTPQLFQYNMKNSCLSDPQHIVLPEVSLGGREGPSGSGTHFPA